MLPFSLAPDIVNLSKTLASDKHALSRLNFSRTSATYITTHGTAKCLKEELSGHLKKNFFSLNIDEGTTNAMDKVINVFVRFYDDVENKIVTDHLGSRKENISTSKNIFENISDILKENELNYNQIISCLLDNCNTMRGLKTGVESLMRKANPNLLDIHGDTVHIVNNSAKKFFLNFDGYIEGISRDIYYDIQDSPKSKELFCEIQSLLNYSKALHAIRFIDTRFLQLLTVCERLFKIHDALKVFYFGYMTTERKKNEQKVVDEIYLRRKISPDNKNRLTEVHKFMSKQNLRSTNAERKQRIVNVLFSKENRYFFLLQFYRGVLMQFNLYVKNFQHEKPMIHLMHSEMFSLCRMFLSYLMKPEFLPNTVDDIFEVDYKNRKFQYEDKFLNLGKYGVRELLDSCNHLWIEDFYSNLRKAYVETFEYLLSKLPLKNKAITWLSALDPKLRKKSTTFMALQKLAESLPQVVDEKALLIEEIRLYTNDIEIDDLERTVEYSESERNFRIDTDWWSHIFNMKHQGNFKYQFLPKLIKVLLTVFSGPLIEGSFNIMDDIISEDRSVLTIENYEAISTIKYHLNRKKIKAHELQPSVSMRNAIHTAHSSYKQHLTGKKSAKFSLVKTTSQTIEKPHDCVPSTSICLPPKQNNNTMNVMPNFQTSLSTKGSKKSEETVLNPRNPKRPADQILKNAKPSKNLKPSTITNFFSVKNSTKS